MDVLRFVKKCVYFPFRLFNRLYLDSRASFYLKRNSKHLHKNQSKTIKVGFVVQVPQLWDKQSSVYSAMCRDKTFDPYLVIVPFYDIVNNEIDKYGEELDFFINRCQNGKYLLAKDGDVWVDIEKFDFDYLFYQRPYDLYMPRILKSSTTVKYTKICYIPYATPEVKNTVAYPRDFFRNLFCGFMENKDGAEKNIAKFRKNCNRNIQHFLNIGYPVFEECIKHREECKYKNFLWAPRWSYDPVIGGSHFMEYYSQLTNFEWNDANFIVRPHPLMWDNFLKTEIIDKTGIKNILTEWDRQHIKIDKNESIYETFSQIDVLISDISSVIPMFFLTGKPIIYCPKYKDFCGYSSLFSSVLPGVYIANNWKELEDCIKMLMAQKDVLADVREQIAEYQFAYNNSATENIIKTIKSNFVNIPFL